MNRFIAVLALMVSAVMAQAEVEIQQVESPGGFKAWLVQEPSIPFVALEINFQGGASLDAPDKRGATNLMVALLEEGAGDLDAQGFTQATEALAAQFKYDVSDDTLSVSARILTENRDQAVALLRESLVNPRFDADAIERVRGQVLSSIRSDLRDPDSIAGAAWDKMVFGDHPYGSPYDGTEDSVAALTRDDILAAHKAAIAQDRVFVAAAGDITAEELGAIMDMLLADLPEQGAPQPAHVQVQTTAGVTVVPFATPQSVAIFGHEGIKRDDPDFFAAYVMNVVLGGGGFEARLMNEVREKRGLTYGVYSYLVPKDHAELYLGRVASANDRIGEAVEVIRDVWDGVARDGVTQDELDRAKTYLTGGYPLRFDGNGQIANILVGMQTEGLDPDYVNTRNAQIEAVTLEDVKRVAARVLKPDALHFVVVGQPDGLETTLGQ
ncbi:M16 family metallopeptidase [Tropicibacter oceani]|uniref:Pitrilysin family protein n=1 Tax=Tropicibacter oceani TaxID=3058420 RepID=A0ABY8QHW9_9RHOB|nr:pitrilysin family protein [Tropicibacter oceani]WGW04033.1 pitrilysin family protein [Tropicibacter oceani]